ncbi:TPA: AbrB/MazE/SpoVT family DNA-binding domain-containing protein [bacterium]|nr:AbrB/MazE/SpoVT family DNA-binding domain-containing protein [bacterium]
MLETGIIRKIDELGRVVIPKEIRKNLKVNEGDPIEIFVDDNNHIILRKYSAIKGLDNDFYYLAKILYDQYKNTVIISNDEKVITAYGKKAGDYLDATISESFKAVCLTNQNSYLSNIEIKPNFNEENNCYIIPIIDNNSLIASLVMIEDSTSLNSQDKNTIDLFMRFFNKKLMD